MNVITCASYYGSGSSAISDLVSEYATVKDLSDFEFRFLHDIDGVSDLEFHLCQCHNRHNSGHALKRFIKLSQYNRGDFLGKRYSRYLGEAYWELTQAYVDELTDFKYKGSWLYDLYDRGMIYYYGILLANRLLNKLPGHHRDFPRHEWMYCAHPTEEQFLESTRKYVGGVLRIANSDDKPYLQIDQICPSQNINRILRYFSDNLFVFIVDRDPRDIYTLAKYYWHDSICPTDRAEDFCKWFLYNRQAGAEEILDPKRVIKLRFEDLVYRYCETKRIIETFTGLSEDDHINPYKKFNPRQSVCNTQVWKKHADDTAIPIIEKTLESYLYPFDTVAENRIPGIPPQHEHIF